MGPSLELPLSIILWQVVKSTLQQTCHATCNQLNYSWYSNFNAYNHKCIKTNFLKKAVFQSKFYKIVYNNLERMIKLYSAYNHLHCTDIIYTSQMTKSNFTTHQNDYIKFVYLSQIWFSSIIVMFNLLVFSLSPFLGDLHTFQKDIVIFFFYIF